MNLINEISKKEDDTLTLIKEICILNEIEVYVVGGAVRDLILGVKTKDIDICICDDPMKIILELTDVKQYKYYKKFQTSTVEFNNGIIIDIIRCRKEKYSNIGSLPVIEPSNLYNDLYRRDFTINAIAYDLIQNQIIDPFNGLFDLKNKTIKKIHKNSYLEDPTRIFRCIKYSVRYNLRIEDKKEILEAINNSIFEHISNDRFMKEIMLMCYEEKWLNNIKQCVKYKILDINIDLNLINDSFFMFDFSNIDDRMLFLFGILYQERDKKIFMNNSILSKKLIKAFKKYYNSVENINNTLLNTVSNYTIYNCFKGMSFNELKLLSIKTEYKYKILSYINNMLKINFSINGYDVVNFKNANGKEIGNIINYFKRINTDTLLNIDKIYFLNNLREISNNVKYKDREF